MNIKETAQLFELTEDTLRYYEKIGIIPTISKNTSGHREYSIQDLNWIFLIKSLRNAGVSIEALMEFVRLSQDGDDNTEEIRKRILKEQLTKINNQISNLEKAKELLEYKIDNFDRHIAQFRLGQIDKNNMEKLWEKYKK